MMFEVDKEKNNSTLLYTSIYGMHFCFHGIDNKFKDMIPEKYLGDFEWDGIKKQMCASTLFDMIEKSDLLVSESGRKTLNLKESARIESQKVLTGKISKRTFTNECGFYNPNLKE